MILILVVMRAHLLDEADDGRSGFADAACSLASYALEDWDMCLREFRVGVQVKASRDCELRRRCWTMVSCFSRTPFQVPIALALLLEYRDHCGRKGATRSAGMRVGRFAAPTQPPIWSLNTSLVASSGEQLGMSAVVNCP